MKKILILAICAIMTQAAFMCGDSSNPADPNNPGGNNSGTGNNTASITLNGGGYSNQTVNFSVFGGGFVTQENGTALTGNLSRVGSDSVQLIIAFPGQAAGTFAWGEDLGVALGFNSQQTIAGPLAGSTTVTSYGAVGSQIVGTFTGQLLLVNITTQRQDTIRVTGRFSGQRIPNQ
jgi:hypothetical protein